MALPTPTEVRDFLEGYEISTTILSDSWITNRMNNSVIPIIEKAIKRKVEGEEEITEYLSGNGTAILILSRRDINELVSIEYVTGSDETLDSFISLSSVRLIADQGVIKSISNITEGGYNILFNKGNRNIKIVYKVGSDVIENTIKEAIIMLTAELCLGFVGARTGGGALNVQGFGRNFGVRGKYQDIRNDIKRLAFANLKKYITSVVGNIK